MVVNFVKKLFGARPPEVAASPSEAVRHSEPPPLPPKVDVEERAQELQKQGNALMQNGHLHEAVECYRQSTVIAPERGAGYIGLGYALLQLQRMDEAEQALRQAAVLLPRSADARFMLGTIAQQRADETGAVQEMLAALAIDPMFEYAYVELGPMLFSIGQLDIAHQVLAQGVERFPENAQLHFYRGNLFAEQKQDQDAARCFQNALAIDPEHATALANLSTCKKNLGEIDDAIADLRRAIALQPDRASWYSNLLMILQYQGKLTRQQLFEEHLAYGIAFEAPLRSSWPLHEKCLAVRERLRIGYVSGDFRHHSLAFFIEPTLRSHDHSKFEIFCYHAHPGEDQVTLRLKSLVNHWRPCAALTDEELARQIMDDGIDILIDLSGHTGYNRLLAFALKPAPIQMTWLGYQATTGLQSIDYRITDASMDPVGMSEAFHTEKLLRIGGAACFQPAAESPEVNTLPALGGSPFTFASLNNPSKITSDALDAWAKILHRSPHSRLLIAGIKDNSRESMLQFFENRGIDRQRVEVHAPMPFGDYLKMHHRIDLILDTFPYNGGTTSLHALWMGVPMITLGGNLPIERAGTSMLTGFGLPEFAVSTWSDYIERAIYFSEELALLNDTRQSLRNRMDTTLVAQATTLTRSLESQFYQTWNHWNEAS